MSGSIWNTSDIMHLPIFMSWAITYNNIYTTNKYIFIKGIIQNLKWYLDSIMNNGKPKNISLIGHHFVSYKLLS